MKSNLRISIPWCHIMKITFVQILIATMISSVSYSGILNAQDILNKKVTISEKKTTLLDVVKKLQEKYNISFIYSSNAINLSQKVSVNIVDQPLERVLNELLKSNGIDYELIKDKIVLGKANVANINVNNNINTGSLGKLQPIVAPKNINGTVVDEKNQPLPGATVKNVTTGQSTVTDANGRFVIDAAVNDNLSFSFIGYETKTQKAGASDNISVQLALSSVGLGEVVVIGYGTQKLAEVTSATTHVSPKEFRQSGSRNALDLIQGKVPGLNITRTGGSNPNSGVSVQLRGAVTVSGDASPLYVIDGIPGGNLDLLQQDDIESVDVLKDGSGAAIYGTSANAGVILITTKKGRPGEPRFDYSTYFRKEYLQRKPRFLTAEEFRARIASGEIKQTDAGSSTDFYDQLINHDNLSQNHNLALSGGSDKSNYRASINFRDAQGIAQANNRKEYTLRLSINQKGLQDHLKLQVNLATNVNNANLLGGSGFEEELAKNPTLSNYNPDGTFRFNNTSTNQYARLLQETNFRKQQTSSGDVKADLTIIDGLTLSAFGSVTRDQYTDSQYRLKAGENSIENSDFPGGGYAYRGTNLQQKYAFEPTIQYKKLFAQKHDLTAVVGYSYRYELNEGFNEAARGFINDLLQNDRIQDAQSISLGKSTALNSNKNDNTLIALFTRVTYAFSSKYLAQFSIRREGSSRFGDNNKFGYFPAASAGWVLTEEDFMKKIPAINFLKLRVGYGVTGNSGFANYASLVTLGGGGKYLFPDGSYTQTYGPNRNPNPDLKWETKRETNVGFEFGLFSNKLTGTLDFYNRTTKDLLDTYTTPQPPFVQSTIYANVGTITSKGIELALSYDVIKHNNFSWDVDLAGSTNKNTLVSYSNSQFKVLQKRFGDIGGFGALGSAITTYEGSQLGEFWGKRFAGFNSAGRWTFYKRDNTVVTSDKINTNIDKNTTDLAKIGNAVPKFYLSLTNNFAYKNFDLRIFLRGKFDYQILNTTAMAYTTTSNGTNLLKSAFDKYKDVKDNTFQYSDYFIENGDFLKIDEVTLGYRFKTNGKYIRNLRLYVTGQNLGTFTGYTGNDPDYIQDTGTAPGIDNRSGYPSTRSFVLGLNVGF